MDLTVKLIIFLTVLIVFKTDIAGFNYNLDYSEWWYGNTTYAIYDAPKEV